MVLGGGTGTFTVLSALKHYVGDISAVITMTDDGGSTGLLRDELGVLPPGDVRQCLVALSSSSETMRQLFNYRFPTGTFKGHAFGNIFLTALEKVTGSFADAIDAAGEILHISGKVIPVTTDNVHISGKFPDGTKAKGQLQILSAMTKGAGMHPDLFLEPRAKLNPAAKKAIEAADLIILGPGNLHTSLAPILLAEGMKEALAGARGKKIYVCNLMTQPGQTEGFSVADFAAEIERFAGPVFDVVAYNSAKPPKPLLDKYAKEGEKPVAFRLEDFTGKKYTAVGENLISSRAAKPTPGDTYAGRTFIRHDGDKLARLFMKLYWS